MAHKPNLSIVPQTKTPAYSFIRFSTPEQAMGDSKRRQIAATMKYCEEEGLKLVESIIDEAMSGYHGTHRKKGALGRFVKRFLAGEIPPGVFIVEAFDRFTREPPRIAQELFLSLINASMDVVTLHNQMRFSAASIDRNSGELHMSLGQMLGAYLESKLKADRIREGWQARRTGFSNKTGLPAGNHPAWIVKTPDGFALDPQMLAIIKRIARMCMTMGVGRIANLLNLEKIPPFDSRKRRRPKAIWDKTVIHHLIRGRQVLGYQEVGHYRDGKRKKTGEYKKVYPAALTEDEWLAANAAIDSRKAGTHTGRNVTQFTNLFGALAVCSVCGGRMKVRKRYYRHDDYSYLVCSAASQKGCSAAKGHQIKRIEREILAVFGPLAHEEPQEDRISSVTAQIAILRAEADKAQSSLDAMAEGFADAPIAIKRSMEKLAKRHSHKTEQIAKLEGERAVLRLAKPASDELDIVRSFLRGLNDFQGQQRIEARGRIAAALPTYVNQIVFAPDGQHWVMQLSDGWTLESGQGWHAVGAGVRGVKIWHHAEWKHPMLARDFFGSFIRMPVPEKVQDAAATLSRRWKQLGTTREKIAGITAGRRP